MRGSSRLPQSGEKEADSVAQCQHLTFPLRCSCLKETHAARGPAAKLLDSRRVAGGPHLEVLDYSALDRPEQAIPQVSTPCGRTERQRTAVKDEERAFGSTGEARARNRSIQARCAKIGSRALASWRRTACRSRFPPRRRLDVGSATNQH